MGSGQAATSAGGVHGGLAVWECEREEKRESISSEQLETAAAYVSDCCVAMTTPINRRDDGQQKITARGYQGQCE